MHVSVWSVHSSLFKITLTTFLFEKVYIVSHVATVIILVTLFLILQTGSSNFCRHLIVTAMSRSCKVQKYDPSAGFCQFAGSGFLSSAFSSLSAPPVKLLLSRGEIKGTVHPKGFFCWGSEAESTASLWQTHPVPQRKNNSRGAPQYLYLIWKCTY